MIGGEPNLEQIRQSRNLLWQRRFKDTPVNPDELRKARRIVRWADRHHEPKNTKERMIRRLVLRLERLEGQSDLTKDARELISFDAGLV